MHGEQAAAAVPELGKVGGSQRRQDWRVGVKSSGKQGRDVARASVAMKTEPETSLLGSCLPRQTRRGGHCEGVECGFLTSSGEGSVSSSLEQTPSFNAPFPPSTSSADSLANALCLTPPSPSAPTYLQNGSSSLSCPLDSNPGSAPCWLCNLGQVI